MSLSAREFTQALGYVGGCPKAVRAAVRSVAESLDDADVLWGDFSLFARRKALARMRGAVRNPAAKLAASNNAEWGA